jgi:hypothetical protein
MSATGGCQTKTNTAWRATRGVITNEQESIPRNSDSLRLEKVEFCTFYCPQNKKKAPPKN